MSSKYDALIDDIDLVAQNNGVSHHALTESKYLEQGEFTKADLNYYGGYHNIITDAFGTAERSFNVIHAQVARRRYVKKLEKAAGQAQHLSDNIVSNLVTLFKKSPIKIVRKPMPKLLKPKHKRRANVAFLSDTHWGLRVDKEEIPANDYNWLVASRRLAKYAMQVAAYKHDDRADSQELYLCLGGDLCQGVIHLADHGTNLLTTQLHGATWLLVQFIEYQRKFYKRIHVECTPDNHMRMVHKGPDRALAQKWDGYATILHLMVQAAFRDAPDVTFHIPKTPYTEFDVLGHSIFLTHGDTVLRSGTISKTVQIGKITNDVRALQAQHMNKPISAVMMAHVHVPLNTTLDNGVELIINGTGSGTDSYAQSIGILNSNPCQVLFESTEDYVVGDFRKVFLRDADTVMSYDNVIAPYDNSLKLPRK